MSGGAEARGPGRFQEHPRGASGAVSRRSLLGVGWVAFLASVVGPALANFRFLFPNVVYEAPAAFKLGKPADYPPESVTFEEAHRLFVFRDRHGFRAISAVCTHLRCTIGPFGPPTAEVKVVHSRCPCHGSIFDKEGRVLAGPAPRPLDFYRVTLSPDGRLWVDKRAVVTPDTYFKV